MSETVNISLHESNNLDAFNKYNKAYNRIIEEFGEKYTAFQEDWYLRPNTYCCILSNALNEVIGGFRLQVHQPNFKLPIQNKLIKYKNEINSFVQSENHFELCESNGFFVVPKYRKTIISYEIARTFLALALQLNLKTMIGIALKKTTDIFNHFNIIESKKIMSPDNYFQYANNPKSFVFEITNLDQKIIRSMNTREDSYILKRLTKEKKTTYKLNQGDQKFEFNFENNINSNTIFDYIFPLEKHVLAAPY
jgi:hypothetical protein